MLYCYPSPKPAMETVMTLKKNPERQIPVSYPSPIVLGTHQDDLQWNCKGLYHYSPPFNRCQPQYSQCLVQTILRYQPYPFQESWYLVTYTLTLSTKHLYQLIWLTWANTGETQTQSQYLSIQVLVFFILFIHLKVHLCFGDGHCTVNGRSRGDQFTGGGQCYRACQIKEQAIKPLSSYNLPCNSIIS